MSKNHYKNNTEYYKKKAKRLRKELKQWYINYKKNLSCTKCPESRWWVLDFHHRDPSEKEDNLRTVLEYKGKSGFLKEVSKCDVLCSNCHRDVHYQLLNKPV